MLAETPGAEPPRPNASPWRDGWVPALLILLGTVPVLAGASRLVELGSRAEVTPENARFFAAPLPIVWHVLSASVYSLLGAFQLSSGLRRRHPQWHRSAGLFLLPCGLIAAATGLWMTAFYPPAPGTGLSLVLLRFVFGSAMLGSLLLGVQALRLGQFGRHGAWMVRAYAIGLGAGTQVLTVGPWTLLLGRPGEAATAVLMGAGWVINVCVAEWILCRRFDPTAPLTARPESGTTNGPPSADRSLASL